MWTHYPPSNAINELSKPIRKAIQTIARGSQTNLKACVDGQCRLLFVSVYPFERPFMQVTPQRPFRFLFSFLLPGSKYSTLGEAVLGIPRDDIQRRIDEACSATGVNYFAEYQKELEYLMKPKNHQTSDPSYPQYRFHMAGNFQEYQNLIQNPQNLVGILSIEGAHTLGNYPFANAFDLPFEELPPEKQQLVEQSFMQNIQTLKNPPQGLPVPFFITFSHHFNNLLAGHAPSLSDRTVLFKFLKTFYSPGIRHLFDQKPNLEAGLSTLGRKVVHELLSKENGQRVLIDTKHMSVLARQQFYELLQQDYPGTPIIHSHGAVNGWSTMQESLNHPSTMETDQNSFFSRWSINLTDEDIKITFKSDGLIGMCLHEGRMPGYQFKKLKAGLSKDVQGLRDLYLKLFWSNLFHLARVQLDFIKLHAESRSNWSGITIGSDYDGIVDPFDPFENIAAYPDLRSAMVLYLQQGKEILKVASEEPMTAAELNDIMNGHSPEQITEKLFYSNAHEFLGRHFRESDLNQVFV